MTAYKADSIGANKKDVDDLLEKNYKDTLTMEDAIKLALEAIRTTQEEKLQAENVEISYIPLKSKKAMTLTDKEVGKYLKGA
jgi:proteasome alpha subunit